jgi:ribosomal protein S27AE
MLVRCTHCYTPFTLSQEGVVAALDEVEAKGFKFYNAYCPRCGRPNMVAKTQLEREVPGWAPRQVAMQPVVAPPLAAAKPTTSAPAKPAKAVSARPKAAATKKKAAPAKKKAGAKKAPSKAKATKAKSVAKKKAAPKKKKK